MDSSVQFYLLSFIAYYEKLDTQFFTLISNYLMFEPINFFRPTLISQLGFYSRTTNDNLILID